MHELMFPTWRGLYEDWLRALDTLTRGQRRLVDAQCEAALRNIGALAPRAAEPAPETGALIKAVEELERLAVERAGKGLAPGREIYDAQNRGRIDWLKLPDWARPSDPDLFGDSPHEG